MTVQDSVGTVAPASATATIEVYDFQRPATLGREQMRELTLALESFARQWATQLTAMAHVVSHVTLDSIEVQRYGEFADALPTLSTLVTMKVAGLRTRAVLEVAPDVALGWVGLMLGGNGSIPAPLRQFTAIESAIVDRLVDYVIEDLGYSLGEQLAGRLERDSVHYNPQMAQAATASEFMLVARFVLEVGPTTAPASILFPIDALANRGAAGHDAIGGSGGGGAGSGSPSRIEIESVPVLVALRLEDATVGARDILGLSEGDILRLPHAQSRPLNVTVGGRVVAGAAVGANGSRLACVIVNLEEST